MAMEEEIKATGTLGIERWVQFGFIGAALFGFWFLDHALGRIIDFVARKANMPSPDATAVTAIAAFGAIAGAVALYRHEKFGKFSREVAVELANVTWPTREETYNQTVVVIVVSVIASIILGVFDAAWSAVTDLIY